MKTTITALIFLALVGCKSKQINLHDENTVVYKPDTVHNPIRFTNDTFGGKRVILLYEDKQITYIVTKGQLEATNKRIDSLINVIKKLRNE